MGLRHALPLQILTFDECVSLRTHLFVDLLQGRPSWPPSGERGQMTEKHAAARAPAIERHLSSEITDSKAVWW
jgi:hypothetical protein